MDDFGMLAGDFGFRPQGKSAPMKSDGIDRLNRSSSPFAADLDQNRDGLLFNDVFGGPPKYSTNSSNSKTSSMSDFDYDSIFKSSATTNNEAKSKSSSSAATTLPVYDKPAYDDDIFDGLPGLKSKSMLNSHSARYEENVFASIAASLPPKRSQQSDHFDDLLGNLGRTEKVERKVNDNKSSRGGFDDLLPGFGSGSPVSTNRSNSEPTLKATGNTKETTPNAMEDPFVVRESTSTPVTSSPGFFADQLEEIGKFSKSGSTNAKDSSVSGGVFDDLDPLSGFGKSAPAFSNDINNRGKDQSPSRVGRARTSTSKEPVENNSFKSGSTNAKDSSVSGGVFDDLDPLSGFGKSAPAFSNDINNRGKDQSPSRVDRARTSTSREPVENNSFKYSENHSQKVSVDDFQESRQTLFDMPTVSRDSQRSFDQTSPPSYANASYTETNSQVDMSPRSEEHVQQSDDIWLTVSEIPLFTLPTSAPPPSRPPPPIPRHTSKSERGSSASNARRAGNNFSSSPNFSQYSQSPRPFQPAVKSPMYSPIDNLENFATGRMRNNADENIDAHSGEEMNSNSTAAASAAAMKEAMDRAEAKFKHAKEVREREHAKAAKNKEAAQMEKDEHGMEESQEEELREHQDRLDRERRQRERDEEEREQRRLEKERAREIEREKGRQAVERATREARERAASEARDRAAAEARLKAERAAVQRAQAEARERAAVEARERAERATAEAREKEAREKAAVARAEADARRRRERAAVERVAAEARERAAAEARERATTAARTNQQKNDNDLESFFRMGPRPSSVPRPRTSSSDPAMDPPSQSRGGPDLAKRTSSSGVTSNMRKVSSATNIVDDLSSIFGAAPTAGEFQDVEGETEERRRARLERHQRTQQRTAQALAEKNQRDLQSQRDQEERHRIAETLDIEIKRWAAGKEGNLRALLSTLQYVLWPECGWQPVSLTDLIAGASVKKAYRKATLCIHPDKVQQKGANLQQKYIAEKVFDLLKEAWNKFNSEELF